MTSRNRLRFLCLFALFSCGILAQPYARTPDLFVASTPGRADAASVARDLKAIGWQGNRITPYFQTGWIVEGGKNPGSFRPPFAVPIFFDLSNLPAAIRKNLPSTLPPAENFISSVRLMTPRILIRSRTAADWTRLTAATHPVKREESHLPDWQIVEYADAWAALDAVEWLAANGAWTYQPLFARQLTARLQATPASREVNDPLFPDQWHFNQSGINLDLGSVWDSVTGRGMNIAVVDDGVEITHPDLVDAAWPVSSRFNHNFLDGDPDDPTPSGLKNHGTAVAGLAAARFQWHRGSGSCAGSSSHGAPAHRR